MHIECTANAPCPTCPTCPGRQTQNWGLTRPRRPGPAQWPWPWQPWSWKNKLFHELFRIQKYSECVDQGLDQGVQRFPNYWNDQRWRQQFQDVSATLEPALSDISVTPEIHKISETLLAETLAHPEIPLTLGNTLVQIRHQHTAGPLKALFANGKKT